MMFTVRIDRKNNLGFVLAEGHRSSTEMETFQPNGVGKALLGKQGKHLFLRVEWGPKWHPGILQ